MRNIFICIFISALLNADCANTQIDNKTTQEKFPETDKLTQFFTVCNSDIKKAVKVIADNKMIGNLTHLKKMDMEGKKYYLLERENLSEIIRSVTQGTYSDLILINNKGVIIYTMVNDDIFGKNVKHQLKNSALSNCFNKSSELGFYIEDISVFPPDKGTPKLFASFPDKTDNYVRGVFIIQIDIEIIEAVLDKGFTVIGQDGKYRIDENKDNILKPYHFFSKIDIANIDKIKKQEFEIENNKYIYYPFNYSNLSWILISKK